MLNLIDSFDDWLKTLSNEHQARVVGHIEAFEQIGSGITEPFGSVVQGSLYQPNVYVLYPKANGASFAVYCHLSINSIHVIHGYDANAVMDHTIERARVDQMIKDENVA